MSSSSTPGGGPPQWQGGPGGAWQIPQRPDAGGPYERPSYVSPAWQGVPQPAVARPSPPLTPPTPPTHPTRPMTSAPVPPRRGKRSRRGVWIALLLVVALLAVAGGGVVAFASAQAGAVAQATHRYCAALLADDYVAAYDALASELQARTPRDTFVANGKLHDQIDGRVTACAATDSAASGPLGSIPEIGSTTLTLNASIRRAIAYTGPITVVKQDGDWKIASVAASLQGTELAPLKTGQALCAALVTTHYAAAYGLLSARQQSQVSEQQFAAQFTDTFTGSPLKLAACDLDLTTYFVSGTTAKVNARLTIDNPQASSGLLTVALTIAQEGGVWKIDDIQLAG